MTIRFAKVTDGKQEMTVNFYPPLENEDANFLILADRLIAAFNEFGDTEAAVICDYEEKAIEDLKADGSQTVNHRTVFGSQLIATFDKVGVRLQTPNGSMVFVSAGAQDAIIAVKPRH